MIRELLSAFPALTVFCKLTVEFVFVTLMFVSLNFHYLCSPSIEAEKIIRQLDAASEGQPEGCLRNLWFSLSFVAQLHLQSTAFPFLSV